MARLYILKNRQGRFYTGITSLEVDKRLDRHNKGEVKSTKNGRPWQVVCVKVFKDMKSARYMEKRIKSWHGGHFFKEFISRAAGSSNGRTHPSGGWYLGSSPSPAARSFVVKKLRRKGLGLEPAVGSGGLGVPPWRPARTEWYVRAGKQRVLER